MKPPKTTGIREGWEKLLSRLSRSLSQWNGILEDGGVESWPLSDDARSLAEIFSSLEPPCPDPVLVKAVKDSERLLNSTLYSFQRITVAKMIEKEKLRGPHIDQSFVPIQSVDPLATHNRFWIQPSTMHALLEPPQYISPAGGGILAEEMGAGKTLIVLALTVATRGQIASPSQDANSSTIFTPLSLNRFRTTECMESRVRESIPEPDGLPTLVESVLHYLACHPTAIRAAPSSIRLAFDSSPLPLYLSRLTPFYFGQRPNQQRESKSRSSPLIYLSRSSLIVVPKSLYEQWKGEYYKFCKEGTLDVLFLEDYSTPNPSLLATYDIVLVSMEWLSMANQKSPGEKTSHLCRCPGDFSQPNIPVCTCPAEQGVNPIFRCRWKRLVLDEGHNSAHLTSECSIAAAKLSVEYRWIVTGTPTRNIFASRTIMEADNTSLVCDDDSEEVNVEDDKDLSRLSKMLGQYLQIEPFFSQKKYFLNHVCKPVRKNLKGGKVTLAAVMQHNIVRHPIDIIEAEVQLPLLSHETILLDLEPMQVRTYNLIQSTIVTNAVDSERCDEDYMFHPKNTKFLQATFSNLAQSLFWHADENFFDRDLEDHFHNSTASIARAIERNKTGKEDFELLVHANHIQKGAIGDTTWRMTMRREDVPYSVDGISDNIRACFSRHGPDVLLFHPDRLLGIRNTILREQDIDEQGLLSAGAEIVKQDALREEFLRASKGHTIRKNVKPHGSPKKLTRLEHRRDRSKIAPSRSNMLSDAILTRSCSSKINFIISEVLEHHKKEKFLIFSSSLLSLMHLTDALQLADIPCLQYHSECSPQQRRITIAQFDSIPIYRVLLMELKHGARGLNMIAASRVLFVEPVWAPDVEAQAIKRVHRTGQTRPVTVKTLAIRDTFEEELLRRRRDIATKMTRLPPLTEDVGMRHYIEHPRFLSTGRTVPGWSISLIPIRADDAERTPPSPESLTMEVDKSPKNLFPFLKRRCSMEYSDRAAKRVRFDSVICIIE
ncbi:hypothetical protein CPB86DRAFT_816902 [Serendipita vermifera]|nr:hypothetical protein CPB86DRAFT_816902 [Serendipita vermifera]